MHINITFIVFVFVVMVAIISIAGDPFTAMLIITTLLNVVLTYVRWTHHKKINPPACPTPSVIVQVPTTQPIPAEVVSDNVNMYGQSHADWQKYKDGYTACYSTQGNVDYRHDAGIDSRNVLMAQSRARDRKCTDGWASKDANYFRHHYSSELEETEAAPWWGSNEF